MTSRAHPLDLLEGAVWALLALLALAALLSTAGASFPARSRALVGEAVVLALAVGLAWLCWRRMRRSTPVTALRVAFALARLLAGAPVLLFVLVAAAAGFAA